MKTIRESVQQTLQARIEHRRGLLTQDLGILLFMICVFSSAMTLQFAPEQMMTAEVMMLAATCMSSLLAAYGFRYLAVIAGGAQVLVFTAFVLFYSHSQSTPIHWTCYLWVVFPLLSVAAMLLFQTMNFRNEERNQILLKQMDDLVLIDPLTGLYNSRALYLELQRQMAYANRNHMDLTLMCIELRYASELEKILTDSQFEQMLQRLAQHIEDTLRLEDRVYALDGEGSFAVILGCPEAGAHVVKNRIKSHVAQSQVFDQIVNQTLQIDLRIAFLQYDPEKFGNALEFRQKVENELQYDV